MDNPSWRRWANHNVTFRHVLDVMYGKFQLMSHLAALRKYMLARPGRHYEVSLDLLDEELSHPASDSLSSTWPGS